MPNSFRTQISGRGDVQSHRRKHLKKHSTTAEKVKNNKKPQRTLVRILWRVAAPGLKPLRLPRASMSLCSPGSPLPHLLDGHRKLLGCSAISTRLCPGPVRYHWAGIVELQVSPDETPGLMTFNPTTPTYYKASRMLNHHTHPTDPIRAKKTNAFDTSMASPSRQHNFAVRVSHRCIITVAEFGRSRRP